MLKKSSKMGLLNIHYFFWGGWFFKLIPPIDITHKCALRVKNLDPTNTISLSG